MKVKILRVTDQIILDMFGPGFHPAYECIKNPLPKDAKLVDIFLSGENRHEFYLWIESEDFPEIQSRDEICFLEAPVFRRIEG